MRNNAAMLALLAPGFRQLFKRPPQERDTNKYNLTEQQIEEMKKMTPKQKKVFLRGLK